MQKDLKQRQENCQVEPQLRKMATVLNATSLCGMPINGVLQWALDNGQVPPTFITSLANIVEDEKPIGLRRRPRAGRIKIHRVYQKTHRVYSLS